MRKNFLLLFLMTLLPLAGWAAYEAPTAKADLTYTGQLQALVNAPASEVSTEPVEPTTVYYAVVEAGADAPAHTAYSIDVPQKKDAGSYDVYYIYSEQAPTSAEDVADATKLEDPVTIAPKELVYFLTGSTYNVGDVIDVKNHYALASGYAFAEDEKLADYAEFKFYTTGTDNKIEMDATGHLNKKGTYPVAALQVIWKADVAHNYDFRFTSSAQIVVAAVNISNFIAVLPDYDFTYDGTAKTFATAPKLYRTQEDADAEENALVAGTDYTTSYDKNINAGVNTAEFIFTATSTGNYDGQNVATFTIKKANIVAADITKLPAAVAGLSYNATEKTLITAGEIDAAKGHFEYQLGDVAYSTNLPKATNADDYTVKYKIVGSANYNDYKVEATPATATADATYTTEWTIADVKIAKAMLVVQPKKALNVLYTGTAIDNDDLQALGITYTRFYGEDTKQSVFGNNQPSLKVATAVSSVNYAKNTYAEGIEVVVPEGELQNYEVYPVNGVLNIVAPQVKVELTDWTKSNNFNEDVAGPFQLTTAEADKLHVLVQDGFDENDEPTYPDTDDENFEWPNATTILATKTIGSGTDAKTIFEDLSITREQGHTVKDYAVTLASAKTNGNYTLSEDEDALTVAEGCKYSITASAVTVKATNKAMVYGTAVADEPALTFTVTNGALTEAQKATIQAALQREPGTDAGVYEINFKKGVTGDANGPAIEGLTITYQVGAFAITPATLTIEALPQTLYTGNTEANLKDEEGVGYKVTGLVEGDEVPVVTLSFANGVQKDNDGKLTITGPEAENTKVYSKGIKIAVTNATHYEQNYELTTVDSTLTVVNVNAILVLSRVNDNTEALTAANGKQHITVQFENADDANDDIWIRKEKWYTMVLPFATSVKEISEKFGYAVVDTLNEANDTKNIQFRLHMQDLPANKPFIFKVFADKKLSEVQFTNKTIVFAEDLADDDVCAMDAFGNKYIGTYGGKIGFTKNEWRMTTDDTKNADGSWKYDKWYYGGPTSASKKIAPLSAYVLSVNEGGDASFNAPVIEIEDLGGVITSIEGVNIDAAPARSAQGWYTISGMKLEGAPTQSGVYVKDGRKVVIK